MKITQIYECEICGYDYPQSWMAKRCENSPPLPPCPVVVGQNVEIYERYGSPEPDIVKKITLVPSMYCRSMSGWGENEIGFFEVCKTPQFHRWQVQVKDDHQMSKDPDSYTNTVCLSDVRVDGKWLELCF